MKKLRVAVLMGGTSSEREISLSTGRQIMAALDREKYLPVSLDAAALVGRQPASLSSGNSEAALSQRGTPASVFGAPALIPHSSALIPDDGLRPDVVFIALHGKGGEDGTIQGMLELLGIPYTGSGVLASALAMDKAMAKRLLRAEGIPVPEEIIARRASRPATAEIAQRIESSFGFPAVVKPNAEGSTIGCTIVREPDRLEEALEEALRGDSTALIEPYISGIEITAGLLGNEEPEALPLIEIVAKSGFYDYEAKYAPGGSAHIIPARISEKAAALARDYAIRSHQALGCRGMSRVDMMVRADQPYVLEVNTIPGMTPTSLLPEAAQAAGIPFPALLDRLIGYALTRE